MKGRRRRSVEIIGRVIYEYWFAGSPGAAIVEVDILEEEKGERAAGAGTFIQYFVNFFIEIKGVTIERD